MSVTVISHNPFGRYEIVRECLGNVYGECLWCGQNPKGHLFRYGTLDDGIYTKANWAKGLFCGIDCARSYHGSDFK